MLLISFFPKIAMLKCFNLFLGICLKGIVKTLEHCNDLLQYNRVLCHFVY